MKLEHPNEGTTPGKARGNVTNKNCKTGWIIAGVFAVIIILALILV